MHELSFVTKCLPVNGVGLIRLHPKGFIGRAFTAVSSPDCPA